MDRQNEGIKGIDPVRVGRFVAGVMWIPMAVILKKGRSIIGIHINIHNYETIQFLSI